MEFLHLLSISWMVTCILISIPLFKTIYDNIHNKPIVEITVINLAYCDCIFCLLCYCLIFAVGISACLLSETTSLSFSLSVTLSVASYFALCNSLWSLTITGILRFISIIKNSEQAGIQSLGPDYVAVWKIRLISIASTSCLILIGILFSNIFPAFFYTVYHEETTTNIPKPGTFRVYWIPIITVTLANAVPKLYNKFMAKHQLSGIPEKYALSLETSLSFPFLIFLAVAFQFTTRMNRLLFYDPLLIMFGCNIIPLMVIAQNKGMRHSLTEQSLKIIKYVFVLCKKHTTAVVAPADHETNNVDNESHI